MDQDNSQPGSLLDVALDLEPVFKSTPGKAWVRLWILNLMLTPDPLCTLPKSQLLINQSSRDGLVLDMLPGFP